MRTRAVVVATAPPPVLLNAQQLPQLEAAEAEAVGAAAAGDATAETAEAAGSDTCVGDDASIAGVGPGTETEISGARVTAPLDRDVDAWCRDALGARTTAAVADAGGAATAAAAAGFEDRAPDTTWGARCGAPDNPEEDESAPPESATAVPTADGPASDTPAMKTAPAIRAPIVTDPT